MDTNRRGYGRGLLSVLICLGIMGVVAAVVGVTASVAPSEAKSDTSDQDCGSQWLRVLQKRGG